MQAVVVHIFIGASTSESAFWLIEIIVGVLLGAVGGTLQAIAKTADLFLIGSIMVIAAMALVIHAIIKATK